MARVVFLLGAGASRPACMPCTQQITDRVLSGEGVECYHLRDCDTTPYHYHYTVSAKDEVPTQDQWRQCDWKDEIPPITEYLGYMYRLACDYYRNRSGDLCWARRDYSPNYEDLHYLVSQVRDERFAPNPLIRDTSAAIRCETERLADKYRDLHLKTYLSLSTLFYIEGVVTSLVSGRPDSTDYLDRLVGKACRNLGPQNVDIATLNHDRVIDVFLRAQGFPYDDGFEREEAEGYRRFSPAVYRRSCRDGRARVMKLHGGIEWARRWPSDDSRDAEIVMAVDGRVTDPVGPIGSHMYGLPIQIGTYNKILDYTLHRHLSDLQCQFLQSLDSSELVVGAGYSFGDPGINARVGHWASGPGKRRLVIVDPHPNHAKRELGSDWNDWERWEILSVVEKPIEDTTWDEVVALAGM